MKKIKNILNIWQPRCLTIKGRITVIKSLIIPHILLTASIVPFGESLWNETGKLLLAFVWNNKKHLIAKHNLIQPIDAGGLKMISIYDVVKTAKIMLREFEMILKLLGKYWHNI